MSSVVAGPSLGRMLLYSAGSVGSGAFFAFNNFVLPGILQGFGASDLLIGLLSSTRSIEGVVIQPTVGAVSDRVWTPIGRRRPFILVAVPLSAVFFVAATAARSLLPLAIMIFLFSVFFNVAADPYAALVADIAPLEQRGLLNGIATGVQLISQVTFLLVLFVIDDIHQTEQIGYALAALILLVTAVDAVAFGKLAERVGPRPVLVVGWLLLATGAVGGTLVRSLPDTVGVLVIAGVGNGAATAVAWPLLTALIPPDETGVFAGLKAASESVAIPVSVVLAAEVFLPRLGYRGIFAMLAVTILLALLLLLRFVHVPRTPARAAAAHSLV